MTVIEITKEYLKAHGFTGLCGDGCGCAVDDLAPCGEMMGDCEAGYRRECSSCELPECICEEGKGDGCTSTIRPPSLNTPKNQVLTD